MPNYKLSGHETFPCRYAWLPKAFGAIQREPKIFSEEELAIVELGVGKNMVHAIRFVAAPLETAISRARPIVCMGLSDQSLGAAGD